MKQNLEKLSITSEMLDAMVDEAASDIATNANNGRIKDQLTVLNLAGFSEERIWAGILNKNPRASPLAVARLRQAKRGICTSSLRSVDFLSQQAAGNHTHRD